MTMLGRLLLGAALALAVPSAAWACSCLNPADLTAEQLEFDLELVTSRPLYIGRVVKVGSAVAGQPRRYRVIEDLTGNLPEEVVIWPSNLTRLNDGTVVEGPRSSCEHDIEVGKPTYMAFQGRREQFDGGLCGVLGPASDSGLASAGQCTNAWLENASLRARLVAAVRAQAAGVSRSSRPLSSSR